MRRDRPHLLDACVLYSAYLRDTLLSLADAGLFEPRWSADILEELRRALASRGHAPGAVERLVATMGRAFPHAEVTGYAVLVDAMPCDPGDRHVLAAAVRAGDATIVTHDVGDLRRDTVRPHDVEVVRPDELLLDLLGSDPDRVLAALERQVARYRRPPRSLDGLLTALARAGAPGFAAAVRSLQA